MGKLKAENPQLSVYYNDREHVTIHSTKLLTALSTISHATHKLARKMNKSQVQISSTSLPASTAQSKMNNDEIQVRIPLACTAQSSLEISINVCANLMHSYSHN